MRLNRVLLLAATISIMIFAMVFTISCSGDDGKNGKDGKGCTAKENKQAGTVEIFCGDSDEPSGTLSSTGSKGDTGPQGPKGEPGSLENLPTGACFVKKVGSTWHALCDEVDAGVISNNNPGNNNGGCSFINEDPYNQNEIVMECPETGLTGIYLCGGQFFNKTTHVCTNGKTRASDINAYSSTSNPKWTGKYYNDPTYSPDSVYGSTFVTDVEKYLKNGLGYDWYAFGDEVNGMIKPLFRTTGETTVDTLFRCGTGSTLIRIYDPNKQFCYSKTNVGAGKILDLCAGASYDIGFAYDNQYSDSRAKGKKHLVGNAIVIGTTCSANNKLVAYCVNGINKLTSGSTGSTTFGVIGDGNILDHTKLQYDTTAAGRNLPLTFDPETQFCRVLASPDGNNRVEIVPLCGGKGGSTYTLDQKCDNGGVMSDCGGTLYNSVTHFCWTATNKIGEKCANKQTYYDPDRAFCSYGIADNTSLSFLSWDNTVNPFEGARFETDGDGVLPNTGLETPTDKCNSRTYNVGEWKWEYCAKGSGSNYYLMSCGNNQEPRVGSTSACRCIPGATEINNSGNRECYCLEAAAMPTGALENPTGDRNDQYEPVYNTCLKHGAAGIGATYVGMPLTCTGTNAKLFIKDVNSKGIGTAVCCPEGTTFDPNDGVNGKCVASSTGSLCEMDELGKCTKSTCITAATTRVPTLAIAWDDLTSTTTAKSCIAREDCPNAAAGSRLGTATDGICDVCATATPGNCKARALCVALSGTVPNVAWSVATSTCYPNATSCPTTNTATDHICD